MNTNMTGFRWFSNTFALEGLCAGSHFNPNADKIEYDCNTDIINIE